jgi:cobalt-zinc-cadmium efflux system outer membrane protein
MHHRPIGILLAAALLPLAACQQAPRIAERHISAPTVALESESLIPRAPGETPRSGQKSGSPAADRLPGEAPARRQVVASVRSEETRHRAPAGNQRRSAEVTLAASDREEPGRVAFADEVVPPMAPPADGAADSVLPSAMTLAQFESIALQSNPSIHQASAIARKAMGTRVQVGLCPNPTLAYMGQEIGDDGTYGQQGVQVSQTIVRGNKLDWNQRVAQQEAQALLWQVETQRRRVLTDVRRQFYETLGAQERVALATELEVIAIDATDRARLLVENQQGALPDQLQAETQLSEISILRRQAEFEHQASWQQLAALVGRPEMPLAHIDALLETSEAQRDWGTSLRQVTSGNPLLLRAYAEAQRARMGIERAEVQPVPNVELQASVMHMAQSDNVGANVQVGLPLPLFNKNQGNIDRAWCEYHRAQWNAERLRLSLETQLAAAFGDYRDAANRVAVYRDEIVPKQQQSLELIELGYPAQFDFLRLFTARRTYYDARVQYLNALVDLRQAEALIDGLLLTGGFNELDDTMIDDGLRDAALSGE